MPARRAAAHFVFNLIAAAGALAAFASLLAWCAPLGWFSDLFSHFRVQYFAALGVAGLLLLIAGRRRSAVLYSALALGNLATFLPLYSAPVTAPVSQAASQRALFFNLNRYDSDQVAAGLAQLLDDFEPEILVLAEVTDAWLERLQPLTQGYPDRLLAPRDDPFGIALFSRLPLQQAQRLWLSPAGVPSLTAQIATPSGHLLLLAAHPPPPIGGAMSAHRNTEFQALAEQAAASQLPVLLLGDLNSSPWSPHFAQLLALGGLRDSAQGHGVQPSWPSASPLLGIPIDHCLHSPEIHILKRWLGPNLGSDHLPLLVEFRLSRSVRERP